MSGNSKWRGCLVKANLEGRELAGASDIQSLADMANSYQVVTQMRAGPFSGRVAEELLDKLVRGFLG
jgi:hypothetical protein